MQFKFVRKHRSSLWTTEAEPRAKDFKDVDE